MEQIGTSFVEKLGQAEEYHYSFFVGGFVWLFSRKYVPQEKFNWGHRVHNHGGYAIAFNTRTREWSDKVEIEPLADDENCEELLFVADNAIHILLLDNFGGLNVRSLYKWDVDSNKWCQQELAVDDSSKIALDRDDGRVDFIVADGPIDSKCVYVLVHMDSGNISLHKLCLAQGTFAKAHDLKEDAMLIPRGKPTSAALLGNKLIFTYGVVGCGFRWEASRAVIVDLATGDAKELQVEGDQPKFCFSGAKAHFLKTNGEWVHVAGSIQCGMTGSKPCCDIYSLSTGSDPLSWSKVDGEVPEQCCGEDFSAAYEPELNYLYVNCKEGIVRKEL